MKRKPNSKIKAIVLCTLILTVGTSVFPSLVDAIKIISFVSIDQKSFVSNETPNNINAEKLLENIDVINKEILKQKIVESKATNPIMAQTNLIIKSTNDPFYYLDNDLSDYFNLPLIHDYSNDVFGSNGYTGEGVSVAVLDSGVAYNHEYFSKGFDSLQHQYIITSITGSDRLPIAGSDDYVEHATGCASLVKQIAPKANIISVGLEGSLEDNPDNSKGVFEWLLENYQTLNIKIVSRSIGYTGSKVAPEGWSRVESIIKYLSGNGNHPDFGTAIPLGEEIMFVFSAGNNYNFNTGYGIHWPGSLANLPNIITVGQVNFDNEKKIVYNGDAIQNDDSEIRMECMAPGIGIKVCKDETDFDVQTGSSISTPIVAGALALLLEKYGITSLEKSESLVTGKTNTLSGDFYTINNIPSECIDSETGEIDYTLLKKYYGYGVVNIAGMLDKADSDTDGLNDYFEYWLADDVLPLSLDPQNYDTDFDTMPDGWELTSGICPLYANADEDPDGDYLTNIQEFDAQTSPTAYDSDGDGWSDGTEVTVTFTDPNLSDTDNDNINDYDEYIYWGGLGLSDMICTDYCYIDDVDGDTLLDGDEINVYNSDPLDGDPDNDALLDFEEVNAGTNPFTADTDADGLDDYQEVKIYLTNALSSDTDMDGMDDYYEVSNNLNPDYNDSTNDPDNDNLSNLQEYSLGTDPQDADTDDDAMPDGWELQYSLNPLSDDSAGDIDGDNLHNVDEYTFDSNPTDSDSDDDGMNDYQEYINDCDPNDSDTDNDGWSDSFEFNTSGTDPADADTDNDSKNDKTEYNYWISRGKTATTAYAYCIDYDVDNDGLSDGWEINHGVDPLDNDCDNDGLLDGLEVQNYQTNPEDPDSDDDGYDDLTEVINGTDPNDSSDYPGSGGGFGF